MKRLRDAYLRTMCFSMPSDSEISLFFGAAFMVGSVANAVVAAGVYAITEPQGRWRWWQVPAATMPSHAAAGPLRQGAPVTLFHRRAPADLRWVSFFAIALGLWAIPLTALAVALLPLFGAGLLLVPTIITGIWLVTAGRGLLLGRSDAPRSALGVAALMRRLAIVQLVLVHGVTIACGGSPVVALSYTAPFLVGLVLSFHLERVTRRHFPETI
jgi:hypothetical protein